VTHALNPQILVLVLAFAATWLLLNRTTVGRQIYASGGNKDAAQRLGFQVFGLNWCLSMATSASVPLATLEAVEPLGFQPARLQAFPDGRDMGALITCVTALGRVLEGFGA
jgi:ABC-type uncharacterized transport system permease subunit